MSKDTLTITDNRTGKTFELPIEHETVKAIELRQIKAHDEDFGIMTYDPSYMNTAACKSTITFIDGDKGILNYRGIPIAQVAEKGSYLETAYLLLYGELPNAAQLKDWTAAIHQNLEVPATFPRIIQAFEPSAHLMGVFQAAIAALSTYYPDSKKVNDPANRVKQIHRLIGQVATVGACCYRHQAGLPMVAPDPTLSYAGNFLHMMFGKTPNPALEKAMDILFILHADHEQNCSTSTMRLVSSADTDPYSSLSAAAAALYGPLHGGANEAVLKMLAHIGTVENIPAFIESVKKGEGRLMGFGHRVYKNYDPRARIVKDTAYEVFEVTGKNPLLDVALELEKIALHDEYFVKRKLYPNVDFYSGLIYQAMGFPDEFFTVLFAIGRTSGWLAQWNEMMDDKDQKIGRPRQIFLGHGERDYVAMGQRV